MHNRLIIIILALIIVAGCSVKRAAIPTPVAPFGFEGSGMLSVSDVTELNFTAQSFFIQRADINIVGDGISQRVISTIKFAEPDSFLISVRALGGLIEVARVLLTSDTILVNDRINSTLYFGSNQNLSAKYGFDLMFFPVLLGDLITGQQTFSEINCYNGKAVLREFRQGYIINYFIDCETKKCKEISVENDDNYISIEFDNFGKNDEMIFPRRVKINNFANFALLEMTIDRVEFNVNSDIEFIPGRNYDRVELR